jgi:DNA repair photolyase
MSLIYSPEGRAKEYSPLALNIYKGCDAKCSYCYCPSVLRRADANQVPEQRSNFIPKLSQELSKKKIKEQVLLSFVGDPYCKLDEQTQTTKEVLELFLLSGVPTAILTKGGFRALRDIDLMLRFGNLLKFGSTLTFIDDDSRRKWEPNACSASERLETLREMYAYGIKTWASIEPVIDPAQSLAAILMSIPYVDQYKIGKINHNKELEDKIDWHEFLTDAVRILRRTGKQFYIKEDLRAFDKDHILTREECDHSLLEIKV